MSSPWNHGKISRNEAEQLLVANGKNGAFLVRQSESVIDAHVLSLWYVESACYLEVFLYISKCELIMQVI